MARPVTFNLVTTDGLVQSFDSDYLVADDLPRVSPPVAGGYAYASVVVDQYGRVTSASAAADLNFAYTDVANVFTAIPQSISPSLAGVQVQFGLGTSDRDIRWVVDGDPTTYAHLVAYTTKFGVPFMRFETVASGVTTASGTFGNSLFDLASNGTAIQAVDATFEPSDATATVALSVLALSGQTAHLVEVADESSVVTVYVNAKGSLKLVGQAGEYPLQVFTADGLTSIFRVANTTGEVQAAGEIGTSTGIRALAFGVYMGVSTAQRFVFNNTGIDAYDFNTTDNVLRLHAVASQSGEVFQIYGQSSTSDRVQAALDTAWATSTDATRKARAILRVYDTAAREVMRGEASGSAPMVGFLGTAAALQQVSGANLTNNVTSGGTNDTIADITDQIIYANDAAAIRNDIYQLARKLKQVNDALRLYGLLT